MKVPAKKYFGIVFLMAVVLISSHGQANEQSQGDQTSGTKEESHAVAPDLADIIPLAAQLSGRLAGLENEITSGLDVSEVERKYFEIGENLNGPVVKLQQLKDSKDYRLRKIVDLKQAIEYENKLLKEELEEAITKLNKIRKDLS